MDTETQNALETVKKTLAEAERYGHAVRVLNYDQETICPAKGMEEQGEVAAFLQNQAYKLIKAEGFIAAAETLYAHRAELGEFDRVLAGELHRSYLQTRNITPELNLEFALIKNRAFVNWSEARKKSDFSLFAGALGEVVELNRRMLSLREPDPEFAGKDLGDYDLLLDNYERGMTTADLDACFAHCRERLSALLQRLRASKKRIRTDFLSREVSDEQQRRIAEMLMGLMRYDLERGALTTTEHPFTEGLGRNDIRITTHYYPTQFAASMYSVIHEGGHALFEQLQPQENYDHFISDRKTMGMHESVSRFYENRIGRSPEFVALIYPRLKEIIPEVLGDVSERELYEGLNQVQPSLIRTEADEFTYTFHIIIRYELEKAIFAGGVKLEELPGLWADKYEEVLGVRPGNDREGVLQDVHWTFGFGYFPTYAVGNFYNAMYYNRMKQDLDIGAAVAAGDFEKINGWMAEHVFRRADRQSPKEWIREITGRGFTPDDFLDYLEEKYTAIYEV